MATEERDKTIPPQIRVALSVLNHTRFITWQVDAAIPVRDLTPLERSVESTALRALQHYMLGEMDYSSSQAPEEDRSRKAIEDDGKAKSVPGDQ